MQYGMVIDLTACIGCQTCAAACKVAHSLPVGVWRGRVLTEGGDSVDTPSGIFPDNKMQFRPMTCQHCAEPACVASCPVEGATFKDETTGIVKQDNSLCIACNACISACPYEGVRTAIAEEPVYHIDFALGYSDTPALKIGTVNKCSFCDNRIAHGEIPACMELCPGRARFYGDLADPASEVAKLIASREYEQLKTENGTGPSVYYLL